MDKYPIKKCPIIGACGLDCGLCPRYYTEGDSRCPGCCGPDFFLKHPSCKFTTCCVKQKELENCALCADFPGCLKVDKLLEWAGKLDSVISYQPIPANFAFIREHGIEEFVQRERQKQELLRNLIDNYNDGRSRSFYCTACQLLPLEKLKETVTQTGAGINENADAKENTKLMRDAISKLAGILQIDLRLRK
jgi:hypothetical protein